MSDPYYPLILQAVAKDKVWGGRNLEKLLGKTLPPNQLIGETWEAWDGCRIENGKHQGTTLGALIAQDPAAILGPAAHGARLPLLFKFIDAHDDLSVQVHPNDDQAQQLEHYPYGKTEAWYILHAEPGATLILGFQADVDAARVMERLNQNRLQDVLAHVPVHSGDVIFVPAGTVHAIRQGIVLAEIQENSDITYRLYDWGRVGKGRDLHIAQSMRVAELTQSQHTIPRRTIHQHTFDQHILVACRYFALELFDVRTHVSALPTHDQFNILSLIQGTAEIRYGASSIAVKQGQTIFLPARLDSISIHATTTPCQFLRAYIPNLQTDIVEPLQRMGYRAEEIAQLGGTSSHHNDLLAWL